RDATVTGVQTCALPISLPVNYGALGLLVLGVLLMIGEAFTPGIGALGIGGLAAFIVGGLFLFEGGDTDIEFAVSRWLVFGSAIEIGRASCRGRRCGARV